MSSQPTEPATIAANSQISTARDSASASSEIAAGDEQRLTLVEETLRLDKRIVETGHVRVRSGVAEEPVVLREQLEQTCVEVVRVPIDRVVHSAPDERTVDGVQILSVVEERVRLVRELVLVEEVHIRRVISTEPFETTATRRTMRAVIERELIQPQSAETI